MITKECPSCGNIVDGGKPFCPMCGSKMEVDAQVSKKQANKELEFLLFTANSKAEVALSKELACLSGNANYNALSELEQEFLKIIQRFPTEPKAYMAYVEYMIKYIMKINSLPNVIFTRLYFIEDLDGLVSRCRNYLQKAKEFADESELEQILQLDSQLSSKIESMASDDSMKEKQEKKKKNAKRWSTVAIIFLGIMALLWLIVNLSS